MIVSQMRVNSKGEWEACSAKTHGLDAGLALVFWSETDESTVAAAVEALNAHCPQAIIIGCSSGGVVSGRAFLESAMTATLVSFKETRLESAVARLQDHADIRDMCRHLVSSLPRAGLSHVFVLSDGLAINGCALASGLAEFLPSTVGITGGLAGDGDRFERTHILHKTEIMSGSVTCLGFYGEALEIGQGARGGWLPFGPERLITDSRDNVLLELDGESALQLYERYLGKHAKNLPASGHLFPLHLREAGSSNWVVRTILGVDRERNALFFGGEMPRGATVRLMRGNMDNLLDGAQEAAELARLDGEDTLAILVSCVGRKMLLKQFVEDEIDAVAQILAPRTTLTGFYSYGEIASSVTGEACCLHNQTMMVTVLQERA
ncbi:MAG: hypothetical protein CVU60_05400 [Deltaproteobacteria bacterium HGW-Deltaproteobacteria-18]|nr:MAG: hypothetical protein CVU60_05400 [Deltaproteobacteria bacterium HGW-Deltaproteobacteria-18]PKN44658.1 MAG: hypothetical protein CVU63_10090 [Deltaproteobacteria bacterium HGW-Deltaproteobacteria-20]